MGFADKCKWAPIEGEVFRVKCTYFYLTTLAAHVHSSTSEEEGKVRA